MQVANVCKLLLLASKAERCSDLNKLFYCRLQSRQFFTKSNPFEYGITRPKGKTLIQTALCGKAIPAVDCRKNRWMYSIDNIVQYDKNSRATFQPKCYNKDGDRMNRRKFICETLKFIDGNFGNKMVLDELAETSGYSVPQFSRLFTELTGITPMRYVNVVRIQNSTTLLSETDKSITEIAFACGFDTLEVFERSFKKYFGISASEYRSGCQISATPFYLSEQIYYERLRNMAIDGGNNFDWGRTAELYAKSRNIYPQEFWEILHTLGVGQAEQKILDIGTGTGVLPMNMVHYGGDYTGVDLSSEMIEQAKALVPDISFICADAHNLPFENGSFDVVTALQCWVYFDKEKLLPELHRVLKKDGSLYIMFLTWLPDEDEIIRKSFELVKRYNPNWSGFMKCSFCHTTFAQNN